MHCLNNFWKVIAIFSLLLLSINTKLAYVFTTMFTTIRELLSSFFLPYLLLFFSRKRLTVEIYTVLLLFFALLYNGFSFMFMMFFSSAKILHGKTCVLLLTERNLSCVITCFLHLNLLLLFVLHAFTSRFVLLKFENCINGFLGFFLSFFSSHFHCY